MKKPFNFRISMLAAAVVGVSSAAAIADTLTPTSTASADAVAPTIPQTAISYLVTDGDGTSIGSFVWNSTTNAWAGRPTGYLNAIDPNTGLPIVGTLVKNPNTGVQETVVFPTPPVDPVLVAGAPVPTTAVEPTFTGATTNSSVLGAGAVISNTTVQVSVPGTVNVTANPTPINYTYQNAQTPALNNEAGAAPYNGAATVTGTGPSTASGSVTVTSSTPAYQTGSYTVAFDGASLNGALTGGSVSLSGSGLFFNALTGTGSVNTSTGVITTNITATPTTSITSAGITTSDVNATNVNATNVTATNVNAYSVTSNYVNAGQVSVSGMTYTHGIDNGGHRITNVAPAVDGMDAVNLNQLNSVQNHLQKQIDDTDKNAKKGIATVAAMANIPQVDESKTFSLGAGVGGYDSEWGFAIGGSYRVAPAVVLKGSIGTSDGGDVAGGLGISSSW